MGERAATDTVRVVSVVTGATLPQARVMARSLARHQPDWDLELAVVGEGSTGGIGSEDTFTAISVEQVERV